MLIKPIKKVSKTFNQAGKWVEKPRLSHILVCSCGNKYIKTRLNQKLCVKCMYPVRS